MSLADRIDFARRAQNTGSTPAGDGTGVAIADPAPTKRRASDTREGKLKRQVHERLLAKLGPALYDPELTETELAHRVRDVLRVLIAEDETPMPSAERAELAQRIADDILGYGPIEPLLSDPTVTEVMVNGPDAIYIERDGLIEQVDATFTDDEQLLRTIEKIVSRVGRRVDESQPMVDARLPDGSRVNAIIPPLAVDGAALTIRKFAADPYRVEDLVAFGTMTSDVADFLSLCVEGKLNIIVSGGTGAGKTTLLNVLSTFIPENERIVTIEDAAELQLDQGHVIRLEARPANIEGRGHVSIRDLVRNALRMRPDRIVVGEVRDEAALDMLQAMNTGHEGSISTVHANSPRDSMSRLETMVLYSGVELPVRAIREQSSSAIDLVVQIARLRDGSRRITHITEVVAMEGDIITMQDLYRFDQDEGLDDSGRVRGQLRPTGLRPHFQDKLRDHQVTLPGDPESERRTW